MMCQDDRRDDKRIREWVAIRGSVGKRGRPRREREGYWRCRERCARIVLTLLGVGVSCVTCSAIDKPGEGGMLTTGDVGIPPSYWRLAENDGMNCLYVQLRLMGYGGNYEAFYREALRGADLKTANGLVRFARQLGFPLELRRLTVSELATSPVPSLVYLEEEGVGSGTFGLVVLYSAQSVALIRGSGMWWDLVPEARFRRAWTGYVLLPLRVGHWRATMQRCITLLLIGCLAAILLRRSWLVRR